MSELEKERDSRINGWVQRPLCVFCSAPWTDDMIEVEASSSGGCDSCGYGATTSGTITINCHSCGKLIYQKDFSN
jgi:hypothetical protein